MSADDKVISLADMQRELGRLRHMDAVADVGTAFIVAPNHVGEALHLLRDAGFIITNSAELGGFVCRKPSPGAA